MRDISGKPLEIGEFYYTITQLNIGHKFVLGLLSVYSWNALTLADSFGKTDFATRAEAEQALKNRVTV